MLQEDKGIVIYCDASARPNPGKIGLGVHGYVYELKELKKPSVVENYTVTTKGYINSSKLESQTCVEPISYFDYVGSSKVDGTNNQGEIQALTIALENIEQFNAKYIHVLTDSEYVRKGITEWCVNWEKANWAKQDGSPIINSEYWKKLYYKVQAIKTSGVEFTVEWVKAHNDILGNTQADYSSVIGMLHSTNNEDIDQFTITPAKAYWKHTVDKHPFINFKRIYFNSVNEFNIVGQYFQADPGGNDFVIGKRIPETGFAIIRLVTPDTIIEEIRKKQCTVDTNAIVMIKLDRVYSKEVYPYLKQYGKNCLLFNNKHNLNLSFVDNKPVTIEINPTGLSLRAIESFNYLEEIFDRYLALRDYKASVPNNISLVSYDITSHFYDISEKTNNKGKVSTTCILKPEIAVGFVNTSVDIDVEYLSSIRKVKIPLNLGIDLPPRNSLKKLESESPKVSLITWKESMHSLRYAIVIECTSGIGIWSNFFSDKVFLN